MGSLGDNLLKLTEFPFSYSFIGLLALIFEEGLNLEKQQTNHWLHMVALRIICG
jgi:hypothetical protein